MTGRKFPRPQWAGDPVYNTCATCQESFRVKPNAASRRRYCSKRCMAAAYTDGRYAGPNSPTWRGGHLPYYGPSWRAAQRTVRLRDPICQRCAMLPETNGRALDVHHLIPFREFGVERHAEANALSNLIALCHDCHLLFEWQTNRSAVQPVSHP